MTIARIWLGILLLLMALGQALSFGDFTAAIETYRIAGPLVTPLSALVVLAELVGGAALLAPDMPTRRLGAAVTLAVATFWAVLAVQAFARGLVVPNCGCFGRWASQELRWWVLLEDAYFVAGAWWVQRKLAAPSADPVPAAADPVRTT